jgi:hypothetical protein
LKRAAQALALAQPVVLRIVRYQAQLAGGTDDAPEVKPFRNRAVSQQTIRTPVQEHGFKRAALGAS